MSERLVEVQLGPGGEVWVRFRTRRLREMVPPQSRAHWRAAGREFLLGLRALLDRAIEELEMAEREAAPRQRKRIEVKEEPPPQQPAKEG
ncbi:MAG: hypothetical protein NZ951_06720 [Dehalococcoidia bacterium]|nr:hypothetical protein [Dehalococcoidia bacterium]MDW8120548.1 hypothetical protein [Chloroflexota bacterium]